MNTQALINAGGKHWQKGNLERVYFNNAVTRAGLEVSYYNTGNIKSAKWVDGGYISNTKARELTHSKFFYDVKTGNFVSDLPAALVAEIVESIKAEITPQALPVIYDKSAVMKKAWEFRRAGMNASQALKLAWEYHKKGVC